MVVTRGRHLRAISLASLLLLAALLLACSSGDDSDDPDGGASGALEPLTILTADGGSVQLHAEVAESPEQRAQGLQGRTELAPDSGMLFTELTARRGFWMKDTQLALTVAFIHACGEILDFADLEPLSEEIKNTEAPYSVALEMEQGWFAANGVSVGDVLQLPPRLLGEDC